MKMRIARIIPALVCLLILSACGCKHRWQPASCTTPKTCSECGITEGNALGHSWTDATCGTPKVCAECGVATGEPLGHSWQDATYEAPKTCTNCGATDGEPLVKVDDGFLSSAAYESFVQLANSYMGHMDPTFEYDPESQILYISLLAPSGTSAAIASNPNALYSAWDALKSSFSEITTHANSLFVTDGYPVNCCIMLYSDANPDNVLLSIVNGQVVSDVMEE